MRRLFIFFAANLLLVSQAFGQAVAGDPLLKGQADVADAEVAAGAAIASSKLATDVLVEADIGAGLLVTAGTVDTNSNENDFINAAAALTCGAGTRGQMAIVTAGSVLNYCDDQATPAVARAALGDSAGAALTGDSATAFFSTGAVEEARLATTVLVESDAGNGLAVTAGTIDVAPIIVVDGVGATSNNSGLEFGGTGGAQLGLLQGCADTEVLKWTESTSVWSCAADAGSNPLAIASPEALTIAAGVVTLTGAANTLTYHTIDTEASAGTDDLTTINCTAGSEHVIFPLVSTRTVVVQATPSPDFSMDNADDRMTLHCSAANTVRELARSNGGA